MSSSKVDAHVDERRRFQIAFDETAAERAALRPSDLHPMNVDVRDAAAIVLGTASRLAKLRSAIRESAPADADRIDRLSLYAEALFFANLEHRATSAARGELRKLGARAYALRDLLLSDARALAKHGLIDAARLDAVVRSQGYLATATEIGILLKVVRERWSAVAARTAIRAEDLETAETLCEEVACAYAARDTPSPAVIRAADERRRAFTLMDAAYDHARRTVSFLRWSERDADGIVPPLRNGGRGRARRAGARVGAT